MLITALILAMAAGLLFGTLFPLGMMALFGVPFDIHAALQTGLLFGGLSFPALILLFRQLKKRFQKAAEKLPSPATHRFSGQLLQGRKTLLVALFLCDDCLVLVDVDKKTLPMTVYPCSEIIRAALKKENLLELHLTEQRTLCLRCAAPSVQNALTARGWLPFQH